jgi:Lrp/AsnC family leucine-responsive transcriptional regulator
MECGENRELSNIVRKGAGRMLDDTDRALLARLQQDGGTPYAELGGAVGLSASAVNDRLKRLRRKRILRRIVAEVDPAALGRDFLVFLLIEIGDLRQEQEFRTRMAARPEVLECHHIAGDYSYLLKLRLAGPGHFERFLSDQVKTMAGIRRTHSVIALSTVKETQAVDTAPAGGA